MPAKSSRFFVHCRGRSASNSALLTRTADRSPISATSSALMGGSYASEARRAEGGRPPCGLWRRCRDRQHEPEAAARADGRVELHAAAERPGEFPRDGEPETRALGVARDERAEDA